jgi:hypothetical protein
MDRSRWNLYLSHKSVEKSLQRKRFDHRDSPPLELAKETKFALDNPSRKEPMQNIIIAKVLEGTNQGTQSQGDYCSFPFFENVGPPLMATLNIIGLIVELPIWLCPTLSITSSLESYQVSTLHHEHQIGANLLPSLAVKYVPSPSSSLGEIIATNKNKYERNKKKNKNNK